MTKDTNTEQVENIAKSGHCRYCDRFLHKDGEKCRLDIEILADEINELVAQAIQDERERIITEYKKVIDEFDDDAGGYIVDDILTKFEAIERN